MNKTALKFFLSCAAVAAVTALILLLLNFAGLLYISYDNGTAATRSSRRIIDLMHSAYDSGEDAAALLPEGYWCILLDDGGDVIWSADMPDDIPQHYTLRDVAILSRWFLCDYPVYTQAEDCGLFILGQPKNAVGKYQIVLSMSWFHSLPARIALVLALNTALALGLSLLTGRRLYKGVRTLTDGIDRLSREEPLDLRGGGIFRPAYQELNKCSAALREKSRALEERDTARRNWVNGISHDIRTPMTSMLGYLGLLNDSGFEDKERCRQFTASAYAKAMDLKELTDELFRYFLVYGKAELELSLESYDGRLLLEQLLGEAEFDLIDSGFRVQRIEFKGECSVSADPLYLKRTLDNMISNIKKYADPERPIMVITELTDGKLSVCISNYVKRSMDKVESTKIGIRTCRKIMEAMGGSFTIASDGEHFAAEFALPAVEKMAE